MFWDKVGHTGDLNCSCNYINIITEWLMIKNTSLTTTKQRILEIYRKVHGLGDPEIVYHLFKKQDVGRIVRY